MSAAPRTTQVFALIHAHTTASDGHGTTEQIAADAARVGIEVVVLTDHDRMAPGAGWHGPTLVLTGVEVTPRRNHILALGLATPPPALWGQIPGEENNGEPAASLELIKREGGWSVLAHPLDPPLAGVVEPRCFAATDFRAGGDGLELINAISAFKRGITSRMAGLRILLMPRTFLPGPHPTMLALWDTVGRRRPWVAIGGADAHAFPSGIRLLPIKIFSYLRHMRLVTTGLWLSGPLSHNLEDDQELVINALRAGNCFAAIGRARGFECRLKFADGSTHLPGLETVWQEGMSLEVELPAKGIIRLIHNGRVMEQVRARGLSRSLDSPGVWRIEALRCRPPAGYRPWIYCNPFYLRAGDSGP